MDNTTTYETVGYDSFLTRKPIETKGLKELLEDDASLRIKQVSSGQIAYGKSTSPDERMTIDWNNNLITIGDGVRNRVIVGYIREEGKCGVRVVDGTGVTQLDETY